jgi:bifunctional non-homologous end joining protein LigD
VELSPLPWRVSRSRSLPAGFVKPCIPTVAEKVPSGPGWIHEIKHDGYRMLARKTGERVRLFTRRGFDWTDRYPAVAAAAARLKAKTLTIDGELVVPGKDGIANFEKLHSRVHDGKAILYAFDLLELDGEDLRKRPLMERKTMLVRLLRRARAGIHLSEHDDGDGEALFRAACRLGMEGIVSKRTASIYRSGRTKSWVKVKNGRAPGYLLVHDDG